MEGDFYEDDEPIEKIREAFELGEKGVTRDLDSTLEQAGSAMTEPFRAVGHSRYPLRTGSQPR